MTTMIVKRECIYDKLTMLLLMMTAMAATLILLTMPAVSVTMINKATAMVLTLTTMMARLTNIDVSLMLNTIDGADVDDVGNLVDYHHR